jgi:hypothetical protein
MMDRGAEKQGDCAQSSAPQNTSRIMPISVSMRSSPMR